MHDGSGGEDAAAVMYGDRASPCMGERHSKAFQESRSMVGGEALGVDHRFSVSNTA